MANLILQLRDFRLTTAEILYHMPDHPGLLQSYLWQDLDQAPDYPVLRRFLDFWQRNLDGKLHSVRLASQILISPGELRHAAADFHIH
ncbi:Usg family protein [Azospirillum sp. B21]|uniref:usg protein n=1 Tax=Azospirillum sp. B21 TaxID=2607496 RepID=UPI0011F0498A|nr:usg protein [Azospirillum sp. B21]KAA0580534.1 Usg family protein [Azospirillum sp. B21]